MADIAPEPVAEANVTEEVTQATEETSAPATDAVPDAVTESENKPIPEEDEKKQSLRMQVQNLPRYFSFAQMKKLISKTLPDVDYRKVKVVGDTCYVSFLNDADLQRAIAAFEKIEIKNNKLSAKQVDDEPVRQRDPRDDKPKPIRTAEEITTPLANMSYEEQLASKQKQSFDVALKLKNQATHQQVQNSRKWRVETILKQILPSPVTEHYRNKSEFTCAYDEAGNVCVGFVATQLKDKRMITVPSSHCQHLRKNTVGVMKAFEEFIKNSDLVPFHEFKRTGHFKTILIRDFLADCMVVVTVFPFEDPERFEKLKTELVSLFMSTEYEAVSDKPFRVTSLYLAVQANASDTPKLEKLAGTPYVYERLFNIKFRISPNTFFQTNTIATETLYTAIGDALGLPKPAKMVRFPVLTGAGVEALEGSVLIPVKKEIAVKVEAEDAPVKEEAHAPAPVEEAVKHEPMEVTEEVKTESNGETEAVVEESGEPSAKKAKLEPEGPPKTDAPEPEKLLVLDICCGAGTIGLALAKRIESAIAQGTFKGNYGLLGVEIVAEAVADAELNAKDNQLPPESYRYIAAGAEAIFKSLHYYVPNSVKRNADGTLQQHISFKSGQVLGVLDPPRAGMCDSVIIGCRKLAEMRRLVYVSCDPKAAIKNLVDLCKPRSRKFEGEPFTISSIQPVDMFPLTNHYEWVVTLDR
uniref:tRNA (uracil(54)-C(5))-methyltransferase n=1 Tax=Panagrellus redivivus TaxID=6233 RepID=A0A7E4ZWY0_PANRE